MRNNKAVGFTLIELYLVLIISSVFLLYTAYLLSDIWTYQQTRAIRASLLESFMFSREQAVFSHQTIVISPVLRHWQNGWVITTDSVNHSRGIVLRSYPPMPLPIYFIGFQQTQEGIKIFSDGTTRGYQGHFQYGKEKLVLNQGGRLTLQR